VERWKVNALECEQVKFMQRLNVGTLACQSVGRLEKPRYTLEEGIANLVKSNKDYSIYWWIDLDFNKVLLFPEIIIQMAICETL
jgi:hypothetical protein